MPTGTWEIRVKTPIRIHILFALQWQIMPKLNRSLSARILDVAVMWASKWLEGKVSGCSMG
jgi:hypothetical protein